MDTNAVTVVYKWTAKPGRLAALTTIYKGVTDAMEANEPGALAVHVYVSEDEGALYVRDEFADAAAVGFHLQETAGPHFQSLLEVATPGAFYFFGKLPSELKQAIQGMGLAAEFGDHVAGFNR
ncbi:putative quinol monooxygenase [Tropicimonas marinistellae]|uniref:putative quinol monooxygenase n=1 Tax=Tropicimonas marinistellae TaxID=1739787 RepID=UPI00082ABE22|nr:antibiotic biosynthesis monooxygenase [Tropicimonas marinistellae]